MASVNAARSDPYKNFKFRVRFETNPAYVAGVSRVRLTKYEAVTLERGVTHDHEFENWANSVWSRQNAEAVADERQTAVVRRDFRKNLIIDAFNEDGQKVVSYRVYRAWVSEFTARSDPDANAVLIQSIKIEHEGWIRDGER